MKKLILGVLMSIPFIGSAQQGNFILNAKISQLAGKGMAYLSYEASGVMRTDSTIIENGVFQFKGMLAEPVRAKLALGSKTGDQLGRTALDNVVYIYLENGEIGLKSVGTFKNAVISGSRLNDENRVYQASTAALSESLTNISQEYQNAPLDKQKDSVFVSGLQGKFEKTLTELKLRQAEFIKANPGSFVSLQLLTENAQQEMDLEPVEAAYRTLSENLRQSPSGKALEKSLASVKKTAIGAEAPDFAQNDVNEKPVKLSDFKGKFVLLDFWASWCGPCRAENPNVVKAYHQYKDKGFTVLGVSLDQPGKKDQWLQAIKSDGLEWTQVSDLKFWNNEAAKLYGIRGIPQNFLIGPDGKIVAKNLRGEELISKLASLLK